jgi:hypothetical protein
MAEFEGFDVPEDREFGAVKATEAQKRAVPIPRREPRTREVFGPQPEVFGPQRQQRQPPQETSYQRDILANSPLATLPPDVQNNLTMAKTWYEIAMHPASGEFEKALGFAHLEDLDTTPKEEDADVSQPAHERRDTGFTDEEAGRPIPSFDPPFARQNPSTFPSMSGPDEPAGRFDVLTRAGDLIGGARRFITGRGGRDVERGQELLGEIFADPRIQLTDTAKQELEKIIVTEGDPIKSTSIGSFSPEGASGGRGITVEKGQPPSVLLHELGHSWWTRRLANTPSADAREAEEQFLSTFNEALRQQTKPELEGSDPQVKLTGVVEDLVSEGEDRATNPREVFATIVEIFSTDPDDLHPILRPWFNGLLEFSKPVETIKSAPAHRR